MRLSRKAKRNLRSIATFTLITSVGSVINALIEHGFDLYPVLNELAIGFLFGIIISVFEIYFFEKKFKRYKFSAQLILRSVFYVIVCAFVIILVAASRIGYRADIDYYEAIRHHQVISFIKSSDFMEMLVYSVVLSFFVNFVRQVNRLLGQNVLLNFITGRYSPPIEEKLIFMFLDLKSSTTIAEKIGLVKNHEFLNDFFFDLTEPILESKARVYQYVGDEIVLTWKLKQGIANLNCLNCFYLIQKKIDDNKNIYIKKYGVYPEFKAGLHYGEVIAGEVGDIKKDIAYHGDTVNTTARIQAECNRYGKKVLISKELLDQLDVGGSYKIESMGFIKLRGKEKELELFAVDENAETEKLLE